MATWVDCQTQIPDIRELLVKGFRFFVEKNMLIPSYVYAM